MTRCLLLALILTACLAATPRHHSVASLSPAQRAQFHHRDAAQALANASVEGRQRALREIRAAIALEPDNAEHWLLYGRLRAMGEFDAESRTCFRRAMVLDPGNLSAYLELATSWKREWTRTLDTLAIIRALGVLDTAIALAPEATDPWLQLVPLRFEAYDFPGAERAAARALAGRPSRPEAAVAAAYVAFRAGDLERADSLFRHAIPRLDDFPRSMFENPASMLGDSITPIEWSKLDPDPTTHENEVQLEYWSRAAHALLLFHDPLRPGIDIRMHTYVRYGPPRRTEMNPIGVPLYFRTFATYTAPAVGSEMVEGGNPGKPPLDFPTPIQVWRYPDLGMRVVMQDRSLHGRYNPQATYDFDPGSRPDPGLLAGRDDLVAIGDGIAVFHRLPPPERRIETRAVVARFGGAPLPRLLAQVEVPGGPADYLSARWMVSDAAGRALAHGEQALAIAGCDPAERRAAQFVAELPPGTYQVTISVRGSGGRRGLFQTRVSVAPAAAGMAMSDLVLACNDPTLLVGGTSARLDANVESRIGGSRPLVGYLEIYRLAAGSDGMSRFDYRCDVRRAPGTELRRPKRNRGEGGALVSTSRAETHAGELRRQFITVPVQSLPPGRYLLEVRVRDQVSNAVATRMAIFTKE